ncbi:MAG: oligosaccharide flippase family protein [bacterium]
MVYGSGTFIVQFLSFITLPIYTRIFLPSEYGVLETVTTVASLLALFSTLLLEAGTQRIYFDYNSQQILERKRVISTSFWFLVFWNGFYLLCILLNSKLINNLFFKNADYTILLIIAFVTIPMTSLVMFSREILRLHNKAFKFTLFSLLNGIIGTGISLFLVIYCLLGLKGRLLGPLITGVLVLPLLIWTNRADIKFLFAIEELKKMLHFSLPLILTNGAMWILTLSDRFFLVRLTSLEEVGFYSIGVKLTIPLLLFITSFGMAWSPFILSIYSDDKEIEKKLRGKVFTYYMLVLFLFAAIISLFAKEFILLLATKKFLESYKVVGILTLSVVALGSTQLVCTGISLTKKTMYFAYYTTICALVNLSLNGILIPLWGMIGAGLATLISYCLLGYLYYWKSQILYPTPYEPRQVLKMSIIICPFILAGIFLNFNTITANVLIKIFLLFGFVLLLFIFRVFSMKEICGLKEMIRLKG